METPQEWWNITKAPAVPPDWKERNKEPGPIGDLLGLSNQMEERFVGCLLGVLVGDILGTPLEGVSKKSIQQHIDPSGTPQWSNFLPGQHMGLYHLPQRWGMYTDDTNSTIALASSILQNKGLWPLHVAHQYGRFWRSLPIRGYPDSAMAVMGAVLGGTDIKKTGTMCFPEGSYANGGAMRIAPVGLVFRNASEDQLYKAVEMSIISSHVHPEAIDAAFVQAYAISYLLKIENPSEITPLQFLEKLLFVSCSPVMKQKIQRVIDYFIMDLRPSEDLVLKDLAETFQIRAIEAEACALWGFVTNWNNPEECLITVVGYGGDTDTVCSIAAALCGALHGTKWIPKRWFNNCENGEHGRDYIIHLAKNLCSLDLKDILEEETQDNINSLLQESLTYLPKKKI